MSITIKRSELMNVNTLAALSTLGSCKEFKPGFAFQIGCIIKDLRTQNTKFEEEVRAKCLEICEKDEHGKPKTSKNPRGEEIFVFTPENEKAADEIYRVSGENIIVTQNRQKIALSELAPAKLSGNDLCALEFLIDETK